MQAFIQINLPLGSPAPHKVTGEAIKYAKLTMTNAGKSKQNILFEISFSLAGSGKFPRMFICNPQLLTYKS